MEQRTFAQLSPMLRYAHRMQNSRESMMNTGLEYRAYDNRLLYVLDGVSELYVDGVLFSLQAGNALYWPSGMRYRYTRNHSAQLLAFNFDLTNGARDRQLPIIPDRAELFRPERQTEQVKLTDLCTLNSTVLVPDFSRFRPELERLLELYTMKMRYHTEKCSGILKYLLAELADNDSAQITRGAPERVTEVIRYVQTHYAENLTNEQIGQALNYHSYYLNRLMLRYTGTTLHQYLLHYRILCAIELLRTGSDSVTQISEAVGFESVQHFAKAFRRITGTTPSDYRR